jgi:hypothetical protein
MMSIRPEVVNDLKDFAAVHAIALMTRDTALDKATRENSAESVARFRQALLNRAEQLDATQAEVAFAQEYGQAFAQFSRADQMMKAAELN